MKKLSSLQDEKIKQDEKKYERASEANPVARVRAKRAPLRSRIRRSALIIRHSANKACNGKGGKKSKVKRGAESKRSN